MLKFKHYVTENIEWLDEGYLLTEEIASNDAKGKLHELLVAKHLSSTDEDKKTLPLHYRNEETQKSPQEVHDEIKASISPEDYKRADDRAREAANQLREHLEKHHGIKPEHIKGVYWTSNKSDHEKLTGEADEASDADIMIHHVNDDGKQDYHGVSIKIGANQPNLRNPGIKNLNDLTEVDPSSSDDIMEKHKDLLHAVGYKRNNTVDQNHAQYKEDKKSKDPKIKQKVATAETSKLKTLYRLSSNYANGINNLAHHKVKHLLTKLIAPPTTYKHTRMWTQTSPDGSTAIHHIENHQEDLQEELAKHEHGYTAVPSGQSISIHANGPDGKPFKKVATISMKGNSGVVKGMNGTVKEEFNKKPKLKNLKPTEKPTSEGAESNVYYNKENVNITSIKTQLTEKLLQQIQEKKKGRYDKDLDANKNGKLDSDDFKILRAKKSKCDSACEETELEEGIKSFRAGYNKAKKRFNQPTELTKEYVDLETQLSEVLNPSQGIKTYIDDFQKSNDSRFSGYSKEQRSKRAIAAFYSAKKNTK